MVEDLEEERPGIPLGVIAIGFELYLTIAAIVAVVSASFIAPVPLIFLVIDHTEFVVAVVLIVCGVDWFVTPTKPRAVLFAVAAAIGAVLILAVIPSGLGRGL